MTQNHYRQYDAVNTQVLALDKSFVNLCDRYAALLTFDDKLVGTASRGFGRVASASAS